nr:MAG: ORF1 [TTV-like mini virus]
MPYYRRRRRWRRYWTRRFRYPFRRRRFWRRRRQWVRKPKKKLKKITIQQWQPSTIKKLFVKGQYPLFAGTSDRIANDYTAYVDEIAPKDVPGGGLYSITVFTLQGLYELHQKARNWWTQSNCDLPLIRYMGCTLKLYLNNSCDYITTVVNCGELKANLEMFHSTQPSVLLLNKRKKVMLCRNYHKKKRPYKKWFVHPPALLENKWYFQKDLAKYPLFMVISAAASFERYYQCSTCISETVGFQSLNTDFFVIHSWKYPSTTPYRPNDEFYMFGIGGRTTFDAATPQQLILLGAPTDNNLGTMIGEQSDNEWQQKVEKYMQKSTNWGNPFHPTWLHADTGEGLICLKKVEATQDLKTVLKNLNATAKLNTQGFIEPTKPFTVHCRYNPQADMGQNAIFVTRISGDNTPWHKPNDEHLLTQGLPLWILHWGWLDYLRKTGTPQRLDTDYIHVIVSDYIQPKELSYYVPIDQPFLEGKSPYSDHIKPYDQQNWHPKINFQQQAISHICNSGPLTVKLPKDISVEGHLSYKFHFKLGGCPPAMDKVCEPSRQPSYPQPGNFLSSIILQNPQTPIEYYLSSFDQRRDLLTHKAAKRLKKDSDFTEPFLKPAGKSLLDIQTTSPQTTSSEDSSTEEESEEETQQQLQRHHRKHRKLQRGILKLLNLLQHSK